MKTNRILLCCSVLFLLLSMEPLHAQNGTQALDKVVGKFQQSNGISATFTLTVFNTLNEPVEKQNGTIKLSGNKFYWNTTSMIRWFATMGIRKGNRGSKPNRTNDRRNRNSQSLHTHQ